LAEEREEGFRQVPGLSPAEVAALESFAGDRDTGALEAQLLTQGLDEDEIRRRTAASEHSRNEKFRDHFETISIIGLYLISLIFCLVGLTWLYHLLTPEWWHWLSPEQLFKLQNIVTGGIIASIAASHVKKRLS
jgi:hypothetical protein